MNMFRFRDRVGILDERSERFLMTVAWLGGYVTPEQAHELGIRNSVPRVHVQLKDLESWGFVKRIATYPAVYQVTKSVTRLMGADLSARRQHTLETIQTRLLTVNFYLEAVRWPVEFVFGHQRKVAKFRDFGCEIGLLPQRGGKPYLWQDLMLQRPSGDLVIAKVDHLGGSPYLQLYRLLQRFAPSIRLIQDELKLLVVVTSERRLRRFRSLLNRPRLERLVADLPNGLAGAVKFYRVRRPVPVVPLALSEKRRPAGGWPLHFPTEHQNDAQSRQVIHNQASHTDKDFWVENGGE